MKIARIMFNNFPNPLKVSESRLRTAPSPGLLNFLTYTGLTIPRVFSNLKATNFKIADGDKNLTARPAGSIGASLLYFPVFQRRKFGCILRGMLPECLSAFLLLNGSSGFPDFNL
jgi:hypothetical protein